MSYYLKIYDNYHYMDEEEMYFQKGIDSAEEALREAKRLVESYFENDWKPGMDSATIKALYCLYGDDPVICSDNGEHVPFSAWDYATQIAPNMVTRLELNTDQTQRIYQVIIKWVAEKHINQKVPGTDLPYLVHLSNVAMEILLAASNSKNFNLNFALKVALLHDVLEDTDVTQEEFDFVFGEEILDAVLSLTKNIELPKEQRMADSLNRICKQPREVWSVKIADRITNLQPPPKDWTKEKREEYVKEAILILDKLHEANPYLAERLANMIELYKGYQSNSIMSKKKE